ncbi:hypothetical protein, partial [Ralstonia solanacearum]|uniref:hypothetical protein n=1 Tax=Ralstonia solanacearum TaxID=305 RepID=UPI00309570A1
LPQSEKPRWHDSRFHSPTSLISGSLGSVEYPVSGNGFPFGAAAAVEPSSIDGLLAAIFRRLPSRSHGHSSDCFALESRHFANWHWMGSACA